MKRTPLSEFAAHHGQAKAAELLGLTQGAVSKAIRVGRDIVVNCADDGTFTAVEQRPFPSQKTAA